jgi:hypothetical protein
VLRFTNVMAEQPIQEIWAYDIHPGTVPEGTFQLRYTVRSAVPDLGALGRLNTFIAGRYPLAERASVVALPTEGVRGRCGQRGGSHTGRRHRHRHRKGWGHAAHRPCPDPVELGRCAAGRPLARAWNYGWENSRWP